MAALRLRALVVAALAACLWGCGDDVAGNTGDDAGAVSARAQAGEPCSINIDCEEPYICSLGLCEPYQPECLTDNDCQIVSGVCNPVTLRCAPTCQADSQCPTGTYCRFGVCDSVTLRK